MKVEKFCLGMLAVTMAGFVAVPFAPGQGFGVKGGTKSSDGIGGGAGIEFGPPKSEPRPEPQKIRIELTIVGKPREWTNMEGRKILASLVAFAKPPGAEKNAPLEILQNGKVRLLQGEDYTKVAEYPIDKLSLEEPGVRIEFGAEHPAFGGCGAGEGGNGSGGGGGVGRYYLGRVMGEAWISASSLVRRSTISGNSR